MNKKLIEKVEINDLKNYISQQNLLLTKFYKFQSKKAFCIKQTKIILHQLFYKKDNIFVIIYMEEQDFTLNGQQKIQNKEISTLQMCKMVKKSIQIYSKIDKTSLCWRLAYFVKISQEDVSAYLENFLNIQINENTKSQVLQDFIKMKQFLSQIQQMSIIKSSIIQTEFNLISQFLVNLQELEISSPLQLKQIKINDGIKQMKSKQGQGQQTNYLSQLNSVQQLQKLQEVKFKKLKYLRINHKQKQLVPSRRYNILQSTKSPLKQIQLFNLQSLKSFFIIQCQIINLQVSHLPLLKNLNISKNRILRSLVINQCPNIQVLILNRSGLKQFSFQNLNQNELKKLRVLQLSGCKSIQKLCLINLLNLVIKIRILKLYMRFIPNQLFINLICEQLLNLRQIDLSHCRSLSNLNLQNCKFLRKIRMNRYAIQYLTVGNHNQLTTLELIRCQHLKNIQFGESCKSLLKLNLINSRIDAKQYCFQQYINQMNQLEELNLINFCYLAKLNFSNCKNLKVLKMKGTVTDTVQMHQLNKLQTFQWTDNWQTKQINLIYMDNCQKISWFNISNSKLPGIKQICQNNFANLRRLYLSNNQICNIQGICWINFQNLSQVYLKYNKIVSIKAFSKARVYSGSINLSQNLIIQDHQLARCQTKFISCFQMSSYRQNIFTYIYFKLQGQKKYKQLKYVTFFANNSAKLKQMQKKKFVY